MTVNLTNDLLEVALAYYAINCSVIAVKQDKTPNSKFWLTLDEERNDRDKRWERLKNQSIEDLEYEFRNGAAGIAMLMWPASPYAALDYDGPHADDAWKKTGIELPVTARNRTRSGGKHLYYRAPNNMPKFRRDVRIVSAGCECKDKDGKPKECGVDLLVYGYALVPPSPGYSEDPDHPLESAEILPQAVIDLAVKRQEEPPRRTGNVETGKVGRGERNTVACSLAGTMRNRGMSVEAIRAALIADNEARFDPPLDEREIESVLRSAAGWTDNSGQPSFFRCDDIGNGERFIRAHGHIVLWSAELGWRFFNGKYWESNKTREIERRAEQTARDILLEAHNAKEKDLSEALAKWAHQSANMNRIKSMLESAKNKSGVSVPAAVFDKDNFLLNLRNGTFDLKTEELRPHLQIDYITHYADVLYDPMAQCPEWEKFLERVIPDTETRDFVQRAVGYTLTGSIDEQCFFILYGTGKNGKSKFVETIAALLGDYTGVMRPESLMITNQSNAGDIADLRGLRFAYSIEPPSGSTFNTSFIKQQTGGEELKGKFLYHDLFSFKPTHKLWLGTNHDVKIPDNDEGIRRRVMQIPFKVWIPPEERDPVLGDKLKAELSGILNWALTGLSNWKKHSLAMPPEVESATKEYFHRVDPLKDYFDECLDLSDPLAREKCSDLHQNYLEWCKKNGIKRPFQRRRFHEHLENKGFRTVMIKGYPHWEGLEIKL